MDNGIKIEGNQSKQHFTRPLNMICINRLIISSNQLISSHSSAIISNNFNDFLMTNTNFAKRTF